MNLNLVVLAAFVAVAFCQPFPRELQPSSACAVDGRMFGSLSRSLKDTGPRSAFCAVLTQACTNVAYFDAYSAQFGRFPRNNAEANTLFGASLPSASAWSSYPTQPNFGASEGTKYRGFVNLVMKQITSFFKKYPTGFSDCSEFQNFKTSGLSAANFCAKIQTGFGGTANGFGRWDNRSAAWAKWYDDAADAGEVIGTHIFDESLHELNKREGESQASKKKCFFTTAVPQNEGVFGAGFIIQLQRVALICKAILDDDDFIVPVAATLSQSNCNWNEVNEAIGQSVEFGECMCQIYQNGNVIDVCNPPPELNISDLKKNLNYKACLYKCPETWYK